MLAAKADFNTLRFPYLASVKIDGIRCLTMPDRGVVSRTFKSIPNLHIRSILQACDGWNLDGELVLLDSTFHETQSGVMSTLGRPNFVYYVFDCHSFPNNPFRSRTTQAQQICEHINHPQIAYLPHREIETLAALQTLEETALAEGQEGIMLRDPMGVYKCGRSTVRENGLLKVKRFEDDEAVVRGIEPLISTITVHK